MPYTIKPENDGYDVDVESLDYLKDHVDTGDRWTLNFGPQHPATHTTLRLVLELDGERIARCTPHIGYLHSGFEKLAEVLDYNQYVTIVSRMNYSSPIANDVAWHHAVETLFGIDVTPRCKVLRTILAECARIQDHCLTCGASALDLGAFTGFLYIFNIREKVYDIMDYVAGQRYHPDWTRVGGAWRDLPDDDTFREMVRKLVTEEVPRALDDLETLVLRNRIFLDRTVGIGTLSHDEAIAWSLSGPMARASGVERDLRKNEPYLCYEDNWDDNGAEAVKFQVPVHTDGDVYARFQVRLEEMRQSCEIIKQLIDDKVWDRIRGTPLNTYADGKLSKPPKERGVRLHRGPDPALRDHHDQPGLGRPHRRGVRRQRDGQRGTGLLRRRRRRPETLARPHPPALVHQLPDHGQDDRGPHARRRRRHPGLDQRHRGGTGQITTPTVGGCPRPVKPFDITTS